MDIDLTKFYYEPIYKELERKVDILNMIRKECDVQFISGAVFVMDTLKLMIDNPEDFIDEYKYN